MKRLSAIAFHLFVVALVLIAPEGALAQRQTRASQADSGLNSDKDWKEARLQVAEKEQEVKEEEGNVAAKRRALRKAQENVPPPGADRTQWSQQVAARRKELATAEQDLTRATEAHAKAQHRLRDVERRAALSGIASPAGTDSLLGLARPMKITFGGRTILEELRDERLPAIRAGQGGWAYDGAGHRAQGIATKEIQGAFGIAERRMDAKRQAAAEQAARERAAREQAARERAARQRAARAQAAKDKAKKIADLKAEILQHNLRAIELAAQGIYSPEIVRKSAELRRRWKELTGQDIGEARIPVPDR